VAHKRVLRVAETIRRELSIILDRKMEDPRIVMATVTRVELSQDLKYAKVLVSLLGDKHEQERSLKLIKKAVKFIRGELAFSLRLRAVPELTFELDDSAEKYLRIAEVLDQINREKGILRPRDEIEDEEDGTRADDGIETATAGGDADGENEGDTDEDR